MSHLIRYMSHLLRYMSHLLLFMNHLLLFMNHLLLFMSHLLLFMSHLLLHLQHLSTVKYQFPVATVTLWAAALVAESAGLAAIKVAQTTQWVQLILLPLAAILAIPLA
jgi:hypothetical protein